MWQNNKLSFIPAKAGHNLGFCSRITNSNAHSAQAGIPKQWAWLDGLIGIVKGERGKLESRQCPAPASSYHQIYRPSIDRQSDFLKVKISQLLNIDNWERFKYSPGQYYINLCEDKLSPQSSGILRDYTGQSQNMREGTRRFTLAKDFISKPPCT